MSAKWICQLVMISEDILCICNSANRMGKSKRNPLCATRTEVQNDLTQKYNENDVSGI